MQLFLLKFCIWCIFNVLSDAWTDGNSMLPSADSQSAIGYWDNSIFIIGGINYRKQLIEYDITSDTFTLLPNITDDTYGSAQYYTQKDNQLFIIDNDWLDNSYQFSVFNLETKNFNNGWKQLTIGSSYSKSCLASSNKYLFVVGGARYDNYAIKTCEILDLTTKDWKASNYMNVYRSSLGCIAHQKTNVLYAFGGYDWLYEWTVFDSIETLSISPDPSSNSWITSGRTLLHPTAGARTVIAGNWIVIIGGYSDYSNRNDALHEIQLIHIPTGAVQTGGYLSYAVSQTSAVIVNNIMYAFGGENSNGYLNKWQFGTPPPFCEWSGNGKQKLKKKCAKITEKSVCESNFGGKCNWINDNNENVLFVKAVDTNNKNAANSSYTYGLAILLILFILCVIAKYRRNSKEKCASNALNTDDKTPLLVHDTV